MVKWIFKLFLIGIVVVVGYTTIQTYRKGYFSIPDMPDGSYAFSFNGSMRGIVLDVEASVPSTASNPKFLRRIFFANPDRRYFGIPFQVAPWIENAWSICAPPSEGARAGFERAMPDNLKQTLEYARLDAVCRVDVDGEEVLRGLLYSVPKL